MATRGKFIEAVPGSGKTRYITELIKERASGGVPQEEIYAVTFTKDAAQEMRTRAACPNARISTIHAFAFHILNDGAEWQSDPLSKEYYERMLLDATEKLKGGGYQPPIRFMCIDEAQDLTGTQAELLKLLAVRAQEIHIVGDPLQSIYSFNGANALFMEAMADDLQLEPVTHNQSYRLPEAITSKVNKLFDRNILPGKNGGEFTVASISHDSWKEFVHNAAREMAQRDGTRVVLCRSNREILDILRSTDAKLYECTVSMTMHPIACLVEVVADLVMGACAPRDLSRSMELFGMNPSVINMAFSRVFGKARTSLSMSDLEMALARGISNTKILQEPTFGPGQHNLVKQILGTIQLFLPKGTPTVEGAVDHILGRLKSLGITVDNLWRIHEDKLRDIILRRLTAGEETWLTINKGAPVQITTVHSAKGLEYDHVTYVFNHRLIDQRSADEANVVYVAMTRARQSLTMGIPDTRNPRESNGTNLLSRLQTHLNVM